MLATDLILYQKLNPQARENSSVVARENSSVVARENSSVEAWGNSSVEAWENSSVVIPSSTSIIKKNVYNHAVIKDLSGEKPILYVSDKKLFQIKTIKN